MKRISKGWLTVTVRLTAKMKEELLRNPVVRQEGLSVFMRKATLKEIGYERIE